jgi:hypothetical protein
MKNIQEQVKESGKVQLTLLLALALAAGGTGVWSELHAGGATVTTVAGYGITDQDSLGDLALIDENGDGTAQTFLFAYPPDGSSLLGSDFANTNYSIAANVQPDRSRNATGSGTGSATIDGTIIDPTYTIFTPATFQVDIAVNGANDYSAYVNKGLSITPDPSTGESTITYVNSTGDQYAGATAGSFTVSVGGTNLDGTTGGFGIVNVYSTRTVVRISPSGSTHTHHRH